MPVSFYERRPAGVLISRMTNDVDALNSLVTDTVITLFQATLTLLGSVVILLLFDVELALLTFLIFPVMAIASLAFRIASADAYRRTRETIGAITAYLQETLSGIRVVRAFAQEPRHLRRFDELNEENRRANLVTVNLNAAYFPGVEMVSALATVGILLLGGLRVIEGDLTVGVLVGFIAALNGFFDPIGQLSQVYTTYQSGMAALDKIFELLDEEPDLTDRPGAIELDRLRGEIEFDDVSFRYRTGDAVLLALDDVSLHVPPGQTVALVGPTGAGKSTFAKLVARFYDPTSGRVLVDGHDLRDVSSTRIALADGDRPAGGVPVQRDARREHRLRESRRDRGRARGGRARCRRMELHRAPAARPADRDRRARGPALGGPAPARRLRARRSSRTLACSCSTRRPPTWTCTRRAASSTACAGCSPGARRSSSPTACRRSARPAESSCSSTGAMVEQGTHEELIAAEGAYFGLYRDWAQQATA